MPQTELASANRVAFLGQLLASIAEINQPISAVVMKRRSRSAAAPRPADRCGSSPAVARLYRQGRNAHWRHR